MSEKVIEPARPPLPAPWYLPFQLVVGSQTSKKSPRTAPPTMRWSKTPLTRQIGVSIVPTGDGFVPAGSDSTLRYCVFVPMPANVARVHGAFAAANAGNAASAASKTYWNRANKHLRMSPPPLLVTTGHCFCYRKNAAPLSPTRQGEDRKRRASVRLLARG